jgi:hypothetical protein
MNKSYSLFPLPCSFLSGGRNIKIISCSIHTALLELWKDLKVLPTALGFKTTIGFMQEQKFEHQNLIFNFCKISKLNGFKLI